MEEREENKFPAGIFPIEIENVFSEYSEKLGLIPEYMLGSFLASLSTVIGNRFEVEIVKGWTEKPMLWLAVVGSSGTKKTPSVKVAMSPLKELDKVLYEHYQTELENYHNLDDDEKKSEREPIQKQTIVEDITIEALANILEDNEEGIMLFRDELIGLFKDTMRYSNNSSEQTWMSIYSNQSFRVNRVKKDRNSFIQNPFMSILGGIQPAILSELFTDDRKGNGMIHRFLYVYTGLKSANVFKGDVSDDVVDGYFSFFRSLREKIPIKYSENTVVPKTIRLTPEASSKFQEWIGTFIYQKGESELEREYLSKLEGTCPRIALLMEVVDSVSEQREIHEVTKESMIKAITLVEYFYNNFLIVKEIAESSGSDKRVIDKEGEIKDIYIEQSFDDMKKADIVKFLLNEGYRNAQIHRALKIPKSTINHFSKR